MDKNPSRSYIEKERNAQQPEDIQTSLFSKKECNTFRIIDTSCFSETTTKQPFQITLLIHN